MFDIGPEKLLLLICIGLIVLGPEKLPELARDAARMLRTLRELATGARTQLTEELGPELAGLDLSSLNPRTAVSRALLGEHADTLRNLHPRGMIQRALLADDESAATAQPATIAQPATGSSGEPAAPTLSRVEHRFDPDAT